MIELPEITKAWMAGFFDGEGSIIIERHNPRPLKGYPSPRYTLRVMAVNTVYSALEPFKMYFGGQLIKTKRGTNRPIYLWEIRSRLAMKFLEVMLPYFKLKQKQAELGIFFQNKLQPRQVFDAPTPQAYLLEKEKVREAIRELNMGWPTPTIIDVEPQANQLLLGLPYQAPEERG